MKQILCAVLVPVLVLALGVMAGPGAQAADRTAPISAAEMVAALDKIRNPGQPFRLTTTLVDYDNGQPRDRSVLVVFAKEDKTTGQFDNLVRYVEPPRDEGKMVLFYGTKLWFYDPASKASVRISPQQRLLGQASNGDVLTVNLARDYTARLVGEETLQDANRKDRDCWHLDLTAANDEAIYSRIEYWLEVGSYNPVKGKFYSDSGRVLKIAYYRKFEEQLGAIRPLETVIIDAVDARQVTISTSSDFRPQDIPDAWFQRDYLPRLKVQ
ncbi:MAG: outer membrane lipoprotein-sorting protein [Azospirillaceae bacterium]|nr:outer membrane lipoprotein-sorting protein [Azospirillaceae bacterium]